MGASRRLVFSVSSFVMFLAFGLFAFLQYNDPDPWLWIPVYALPALVSGWAGAGRSYPWAVPALVAAVAVIGAALLGLDVIRIGGHPDFGEVFNTTRMTEASVEETREAFGLLIVAAWMAFLAWRARRAAR